MMIPASISAQIALAHPSWHTLLEEGLVQIAQHDPDYLIQLEQDIYLPTQGRLFAAFSLPIDSVKYVLVGEGPYPREESATGVCFMDGAVKELWSDKGLSKKANRATSLRNFIKMLLVADHQIDPEHTSGNALESIAAEAVQTASSWITTCQQLQDNLQNNGFLLLNASLVFRTTVKPVRDTKAWKPFFDLIVTRLAEYDQQHHIKQPTFILWGKLAEQLVQFCHDKQFPTSVSEHPYNLSFIHNQSMQQLFQPMQLLNKML